MAAPGKAQADGPGRPTQDFVSNFCMVAHLHGRFSDEDLRRALDRVRSRHPQLVPGLGCSRPGQARFELRVRERCQAQDWLGLVKEELLAGFPDPGGPQARFVLLRRADRADLVSTFNHGRCDGLSGVFVLRDVLRLLGEPQAHLPPLPPPPPAAALIPASTPGDARLRRRVQRRIRGLLLARSLRRLRARLLPKRASRLPTVGAPDGSGLSLSQRFCILTHTLGAAETTALLARCRAERTTVHAAVCTAWTRALAAQSAGPRRRWISSPVDLRGRLDRPVDETAGLFLTTVETRCDGSPSQDFWQAARRFKRGLERACSDARLFFLPLLFSTLFPGLREDERGEMAALVFGRPVRYDFSITNLGRLDIPARVGAIELEGFHNLVNSSEHERTVGVNTLAGRMTFTLIVRESKMAPEAASRLMRKALEGLAEAAGGASKDVPAKP